MNTLFLALFLVIGALLPLITVYKKIVTGNKIKYAFLFNAFSFFCLCFLVVTSGNLIPALAADTVTTAASTGGWKYIGAALSTGLACIGGGIAVANAAGAALGALSEDPKIMGKAMIFVALAEGIALYGVIISILILNN